MREAPAHVMAFGEEDLESTIEKGRVCTNNAQLKTADLVYRLQWNPSFL